MSETETVFKFICTKKAQTLYAYSFLRHRQTPNPKTSQPTLIACSLLVIPGIKIGGFISKNNSYGNMYFMSKSSILCFRVKHQMTF